MVLRPTERPLLPNRCPTTSFPIPLNEAERLKALRDLRTMFFCRRGCAQGFPVWGKSSGNRRTSHTVLRKRASFAKARPARRLIVPRRLLTPPAEFRPTHNLAALPPLAVDTLRHRKTALVVKPQRIEPGCQRSALSQTEGIAPIGHWEWEFESDRVRWSDGIYRLLGLDPERTEPSLERFLDAVQRWPCARVPRPCGQASFE